MRRALLLIAFAAVSVPAQAAAAPRAVRGPTAGLDAAGAPPSQLRKVDERRVAGRRFRRYRQVVAGLPVLGSEAVITDAAGSRADLLVDGTRRLGRPPRGRLGRSRALAVAIRRAGAGRLRGRAVASRAILPRAGGARVVWRVLLPTRRPVALYEVLVDARSAAVLGTRDLVRRVQQAQIFDPNPVVTNGTRGTLSDASPDSAFTAFYEIQPLPRLTDANCLFGLWARARADILGGDACTAGADFSGFDRSDPQFEAAMAYFHIDRTQDYIQSTLGLIGVNDRRTTAEVDGTTDDNSFYLPDPSQPGEGTILFGLGGVDDAEDAEVIVHEYGHAIQDNQVPGFGASAEGAAMGEGFSDYLASAMTSELSSPPPAADPGCFAEWDGLGFGIPGDPPCLRRVDRNLTAAQVGPGSACDDDPTPGVDIEVHCAGEAWSGALWDIRAQVGGALADRKIIESHFSLDTEADFHAGALALIAAYQGDPASAVRAQAPFVRSLLLQRGLLDAERLDDTPAAATPLGVPGSRTGQLQKGRDDNDVYSLQLTAGRGVVFRLRPAGGQHDFDLRLLRPGSQSVADAPVAQAEAAGSTEDLAHTPTQTGRYFLDVRAFLGSGGYTLAVLLDTDSDARPDVEDNCRFSSNPGQEDADGDRIGDPCDRFPDDRLNDADRDGLGADEDNCPSTSNRRQADWDADDRGDACDRSSRVTLRRLRSRTRRTLKLRATLRPSLLRSNAVTVRIERRRCSRCRFSRVTTARRGRAKGRGRVDFSVRLRRGGRYRLRATLSDRRYNKSRSRLLKLTLR